jgi:hypothetical protein
MRTDFSYSNMLGWNSFPLPPLTEKNKSDLARCAEDILLAREAHFPATIAELYEVKDGVRKMPPDLREAHVRQLDIDLIDRINPFGEAYAILAKTMSEESLKQVAAAIAAKRTSLSPQEALELADRARRFIRERGRPPLVTSSDAWEKRMAEGAAAFMRFRKEGRYD